MDNGVYLPDMRQKFVAQTLALGRTFDQPCNVHKLNGGRREFVRVVHFCQLVQPFVRHADHTHIRLYCAKRIVGYFGFCLRYRVEQRAFSYIRVARECDGIDGLCHSTIISFASSLRMATTVPRTR